MKKVFRNLLILSISVTGLSGCDLFSSSEGDVEKKEEKGIELRDYTQSVVQDASYTFDGKVFLKYVDESEKEVTSDCSFDYTYLDTSKVGNNSYFKVRYEGNQYIFNKKAYIDVTKKVLLLDITLSGYSTYCKLGTAYTFDGKVTASYDDKSTKVITDKVTVDTGSLNTSVEGFYDVKISYTENGVTAHKTITVKVAEHAGALSNIKASGYTNTIDKGETYTFDGTVTANYTDNTSEIVTDRCTFSTLDTSSAGNKSQTITFKDTLNNVTKTTTATIEVIAHVEGISLQNNSLEVGVGKTKTISASVTPSDAKNKGLNYVSNNTNIATVDSNGKVTGVAIGNTTITVSSQEKSNITATVNVSVAEVVQDKWTIMIYMCGADLESQGGYATKDIVEILNISGQPDDVNILVETGGASTWKLSSSYIDGATSVPSNQLGRWYISGKKLHKVEFLTSASMGETATYQSFLQWGLNNYPADKVGVILWNHGGGLDGVCYDENFSDDSLLNSEMRSAHAAVIGSDKLEFIGFDACLMQNMEIADYNAAYFNYQVASQESEAGDGWYYTGWVDDLYADRPTSTILNAICDTFISSVGSSSDQTLSYLDLSQLSTFKTAFESYASALKSQLDSKSVNKDTFATYVRNNVKGYSEPGYGGYGQFDVKNFVTKLQSQTNYKVDDTYATAVTTALSSLVGHNKTGTGAGQSNGVSLTYKCSYYSSYKASEIGYTNWNAFNSSYGSTSSSGGGWYY